MTKQSPLPGTHSEKRKGSSVSDIRFRRTIILILSLAFLIRFFFIPNPGFEADVAFWKSWGLAPLDHGIVWSMKHTNNNYPTPFAYVLRTMAWTYSLFKDPHNYREFWQNTNTVFLAIAKAPAILSDFAIFFLFLFIGKNAASLGFPKGSRSLYLLLGALYILNPLSIIDGAWWGQVDSFGVLLFLLSFMAFLYKKPFLAGLLFITAMMNKLQNMIYGPLYFLLIWQTFGYHGLVRSVAGAFVGFFTLNGEFFLAKEMPRVIQSLTENYDYFPLMSLNAYNPWWIVARGAGMDVSDKMLAVGIINAKKVGLILFAGMYLLASLNLFSHTLSDMWKRSGSWAAKLSLKAAKRVNHARSALPGENPLLFSFLISLCIVAFGFFLFQTQSHDRYAFPLSVFLLLVTPFLPKNRQKLWIGSYIAWSILYFYNLHSALAVFYPHNAVPALTALVTPTLTITASYLTTAVFFLFLLDMKKFIPTWTIIVPVVCMAVLLVLGNMPLIMRHPVYLSDLTPFKRTQDWGRSIEDKAGSSGRSSKEWNRLSVQYYFYRKGTGTHAHSSMFYDVGGLFEWFTTDYGVDTQAGPQGSVTFEVWGDGLLLWQSEKKARYENPGHINVNITGVKTLELIVTDGGNGNTDDHAGWYNAKLWPHK